MVSMADEQTRPEPGADRPQPGAPAWQAPSTATSGGPPGRRGWTGGRIALLVIGSLLALISLGLLALGGAATWLQTHRQGGYVNLGSRTIGTPGYALASNPLDLGSRRWSVLGTVRLRATAQQSIKPVFVGIADSGSANNYLAGVQYTSADNVFTYGSGKTVAHNGGAPPRPPAATRIWVAQASGTGTQTVVWPAKGGHWTVVVMNATASSSVNVHADVAATLPPLPWIALGLDVGGVLLLAGSVALIVVPIRRATRRV
jgi:hypothetical protein